MCVCVGERDLGRGGAKDRQRLRGGLGSISVSVPLDGALREGSRQGASHTFLHALSLLLRDVSSLWVERNNRQVNIDDAQK